MHLYFSTGQYKNVIKKVKERCFNEGVPIPELKFKGTPKIHGSNCSLFNNLKDNTITTQSRNGLCTVDADNYGFAAKVKKEQELFLTIFSKAKEIIPHNINETMVIYGEYCGEEIQKVENLGVGKLSKTYIIFSMKLIDSETGVEKWFSDKQMDTVLNAVGQDKLEEKRIYNINSFETYELTIDMNNPKLKQNELIKLTNEVEKLCPIAKKFGLDGIGEGIVWKCVSQDVPFQTDDLVFKVKGSEHSVSNVITIAEVDIEKVNSINEFVNMVLTENRLNQAVEYLKEKHLNVQISNMSVFLKWITSDCIKEEGETLKESKLEIKDVMPAISNNAKQWFLRKIAEVNKPTLKM